MKKLFALPVLCLFLISCGENENENHSEKVSDTARQKSINSEAARIVLESVPSPVETAEILKDAGASYDPALLNDPANASKYNTKVAQALNLGVFGADLSFTCIFDQPQESRYFLKSIGKLAKALAIDESFKQMSEERMEQNIDIRDSLLAMVNEAFWDADERLREQQRPSHSALIVTGGWIEGMYLATQLAGKGNNDKLTQRIAEQKRSASALKNLLLNYKDDEAIKPFLKSIDEISTLFSSVEDGSGAVAKTDSVNKQTEIGGTTPAKISPEQLKNISRKVSEVRASIINMN